MIRLSRYSRGRTDYHSPSESPWEIPRRERRTIGPHSLDPRSVISGFLIVVRIRRCVRRMHTRMHFRARTNQVQTDGLEHVRTILHFPTTVCGVQPATTHLAADGLRLNISSTPKRSFPSVFPLFPHVRSSTELERGSCPSRSSPSAVCYDERYVYIDDKDMYNIYIYIRLHRKRDQRGTLVSGTCTPPVVPCRRARSRKRTAAVADCTIMQRDGYLRITI